MLFWDYFVELMRPGSTVSKPEHQPRAGLVFSGPLEAIPDNRAEVIETYGDPGAGAPSKDFRRMLTVARDLPGTWNKGRNKLYCHKLVEPYLREALERCARAGVIDEITRLGCYTHRHQRHDKRRPLSYHSWGIAVDINPGRNKARRFRRGLAPEPFSKEWSSWWPKSVSRELVECFESAGWSWGGRWETFVDPMHFELVR